MQDDAVFCSSHWERFGKVSVQMCDTHKVGTHHFNDECIYCLYDNNKLEETMTNAGFTKEDVKIFLPRMKFVRERIHCAGYKKNANKISSIIKRAIK